MLRVLACVTQEHQPWIVALAVLVCVAGTFTSVRLLQGGLAADDNSRRWWVATGAVAGGGTIWATHFVAMLAHRSGTPLAFDLVLTVASVVFAVGLTWLGFQIAARGGGRRLPLVLGGVVVGGGIGIMHHVGMIALAIPGALVFDPAYTSVSVVIGCASSAAAFVAAARGDDSRHRVAASLLLTLAIAGLHFTSFSGTAIALDGRPVEGWVPDGPWLAVAVAVAAVAILAACACAPVVEQNLRLRVANEARIRELAETTFEGILVHADSLVVDSNPALHRLVGLDGTALAGRSVVSLFPECRDELWDGLLNGDFAPLESVISGARGELVPVELQGRRTVYRGQPAAVLAVRNISDRRLALHDPLTSLANRTLLRGRLSEAIARAQRTKGTLAVLCLDLDGFKAVNDTHGHAVGDNLLCEVAARLSRSVREVDTVARLGGDEFVVLQSGPVEPAEARTLADRLVSTLAEPYKFNAPSAQCVVTTSVGIAIFPDDGSDPETLLHNADTALYRAKRLGKNRSALFQPEMDRELHERRLLERDLKQAVANGEFALAWQPLASASGAEDVTGFEVLLRWHHPERGLVPPDAFIPVAEGCGAISAIGAWVLQQACSEAARWERPLRVAVNVSPVQIQQGEVFAELVERTLAASGLAASRLELEVTEGVLIRDADRALTALRRVEALGVRVALDDFGTGYSSLSVLRAFRFDRLKIDRSFIAGVAAGGQDAAIVQAVLGLARGLGLPVVAEGVETEAQLRTLQAEGCEEVQGWLIGRPAPIESFAYLTGAPTVASAA